MFKKSQQAETVTVNGKEVTVTFEAVAPGVNQYRVGSVVVGNVAYGEAFSMVTKKTFASKDRAERIKFLLTEAGDAL